MLKVFNHTTFIIPIQKTTFLHHPLYACCTMCHMSSSNEHVSLALLNTTVFSCEARWLTGSMHLVLTPHTISILLRR